MKWFTNKNIFLTFPKICHLVLKDFWTPLQLSTLRKCPPHNQTVKRTQLHKFFQWKDINLGFHNLSIWREPFQNHNHCLGVIIQGTDYAILLINFTISQHSIIETSTDSLFCSKPFLWLHCLTTVLLLKPTHCICW